MLDDHKGMLSPYVHNKKQITYNFIGGVIGGLVAFLPIFHGTELVMLGLTIFGFIVGVWQVIFSLMQTLLKTKVSIQEKLMIFFIMKNDRSRYLIRMHKCK